MADKRAAAEQLRVAAQRLEQIAERATNGGATREESELTFAEALAPHRQLFAPRPRAKKGEGGRPRLLAYFSEHVGLAL
jgi:hypothetical protein